LEFDALVGVGAENPVLLIVLVDQIPKDRKRIRSDEVGVVAVADNGNTTAGICLQVSQILVLLLLRLRYTDSHNNTGSSRVMEPP